MGVAGYWVGYWVREDFGEAGPEAVDSREFTNVYTGISGTTGLTQVKLKNWGHMFMCRVGVEFCLDCLILLRQDCSLLQWIVAAAKVKLPPTMEGLQAVVQLEDIPLGEGELAQSTALDPSLRHALSVAQAGRARSERGPWFQLRNGLLYRCKGDFIGLRV